MSIFNLRNVLLGIIGTLTMDVLSIASIKLQLIAPLPPDLIGRWFASVARGQGVHGDIGQVSPIQHEMTVALPVHYAISVTLALMYVLACSTFGLSPRSPVTALGFALCTNLLPWLLMFPAMGYGWLGAHGATGTRLFASSFLTHCFYGLRPGSARHFWLNATECPSRLDRVQRSCISPRLRSSQCLKMICTYAAYAKPPECFPKAVPVKTTWTVAFAGTLLRSR